MNQCEETVPTGGMTSLFTTSADLAQSNSGEARADGTRQLARAVLLLAMHDLGAWCRKCPHHQCQCRLVRRSAIAFLRDEPMENIPSTLTTWCDVAGWDATKIREFFSEGREGIWIPFVIKMRSPYRRARRGASAPTEASVVDLLLAYRPQEKLEIRIYESVNHLLAGVRVLGDFPADSGRPGCREPDDC